MLRLEDADGYTLVVSAENPTPRGMVSIAIGGNSEKPLLFDLDADGARLVAATLLRWAEEREPRL